MSEPFWEESYKVGALHSELNQIQRLKKDGRYLRREGQFSMSAAEKGRMQFFWPKKDLLSMPLIFLIQG
jgi:hypothetical protein